MHSTSLPCTAETQEPHWPSTGGNLPARSAAAGLSPLPTFTPFFASTSLPCTDTEPHRSSTGIKTPALSAAAVLSLCRHITISFLLCFTSADVRISFSYQQCCLAQTQEPRIGLQRAQIFLHSARLLSVPSAVISHFILRSDCSQCEGVAKDEGVAKTKALTKAKASKCVPSPPVPRPSAIFRSQPGLSCA